MSIQDTLNTVKAKLEELQKDRRFRRANLSREEKVALQTALAMCRGKMEICQRDFARIIRDQSRNIREGDAIGADTYIQEQMLTDAAIGYMLVKDAIYALRTINTHSSIAHAYEMMDLATKTMSGKKSGLPLKSIKDRNFYGYPTSSAAYQEKFDLVSGFFEELVETGDIEQCLSSTRDSRDQEAARRNSYTSGSHLPQRDSDPYEGEENSAMARLRGSQPQPTVEQPLPSRGNPRAHGNDYGDKE